MARILFAGSGWFPKHPGGSERYVYELTRQLTEASDQVELCGVGVPEDDPASPVTLTNLCEADWPLWRRWHSTRARFPQRSMTTPDAINLHFPLYTFPLLSQLPPGVPVTFTFHGPWDLESQQEGRHALNVGVKRWIERRVYRRCDRFIVLSKAFGTILHEHHGVPWELIHIIPGGVNTARFQIDRSRQDARAALGWPQDRRILFTPRRLVQRMGLDRLLEAVARLRPRVPDLWLGIAGKGPLQKPLAEQAEALSIGDAVAVLGYLPEDDLPVAYQAADLTVVPSQALEGFGLVLLESLACGTPVVCTPVGGMPEVLADFTPEFITASAETDALVQTLEKVLAEEGSMPSRTVCRTYATTNFNWADIAQRVRQVLLA